MDMSSSPSSPPTLPHPLSNSPPTPPNSPQLPMYTPSYSQSLDKICFIYCDLIRSNKLQKSRLQSIRNMSSHIDVMKEKQQSYTGKMRKIPLGEFNFIMTQIQIIFSNLIKKISNPHSLSHLTKQAIHYYDSYLPIYELPMQLQNEVSNICCDTVEEEVKILNIINLELDKTNDLYNTAFSNKKCPPCIFL